MFARSVCLVLEHKVEHSIAVVLNRPFALDVKPLWDQLTEGLSKTAQPPHHLNFGGPQSGPVVAIHDRESLAEGGNGNGIYMAAQVETLKKLALVPPQHYRLLVGHAAWNPGQLEREITSGMWFPLPASPGPGLCRRLRHVARRHAPRGRLCRPIGLGAGRPPLVTATELSYFTRTCE